ncbi:hypothetical protein [Leisingera caerulea]|uniref:hypothetical protein n=1 Tax=Leisingera caerulea TaxID=506591 RepID=UPI0021A53E6F|nr:hypothetical protein [Leisingera caerulea]UWQ82726.1 hypothetical protein K3726_13670 [Leisingera caerulea]
MALGKVLPDVLKVMSAGEMNFLTTIPGKRGYSHLVNGSAHEVKGRQTQISASDKILKRIEKLDISFSDIRRSQSEEVIELREPKERNDKAGALVEYSDTEETVRLRGELRSINSWLGGADIECELSSTADRRLKRVFNNSDFEQGGRLYGGFWQKIKSEDRLGSIIIDDDSVVELDYGQMGLLLLYGLAGATPPSGDLYDLSTYGIPYSCRPGLKKVIQAAINSDKRLRRMPRGARKTIPKRYSLKCILSAVSECHSEVYRYFGSGVGMQTMRLESDILVQVLLSLKDKRITALPVHDAILVNANFEEAAKEVMIEEFRKKTGLIPEVNTEHP